MTWPTLTLEVAFGSDATSTSPTFSTISNRLLDFDCQRGRNMELDTSEVGQLTAILRNHDRALDPSSVGVVTNYCENPSFETNTSEWNASNLTLARDSAQAKVGSWSGKCTITSIATQPYIYFDPYVVGADNPPLTAGTTYTWTAWVYASGGAIGDTVRIQWTETGGASPNDDHATSYVLAAGWNELSTTASILRSDRTALYTFVVFQSTSVSDVFYVDACQFENSATRTPYVDGDQDDGRWTGTAHASATIRGSHFYPNVVPVRQARLKANVLATDYDIFRGDVLDWPQDWQGRVNNVPITMADGFDALNVADFTTSRPVELSGARVGAILDAIGWPASMRSIDAGQSYIQALDYEAANALQAMQDVATAESGVLFMSPTGQVVFHNRHRRILDTTLQATFSNEPTGGELPLVDAKITYRRERLWNSVFVTQNGGSTYTATDATSQSKYRVRALTRTVYLSDTNECQSMADYFRDTYKDPAVRIEEVTVAPGMDDNLWAQALGRVIGDRIRVKVKPPGRGSDTITSDVTIEGIGHRVNGELQRWETTFRCSPSNTATFWILGTGELDDSSGATTTRLGY